ncbi:hypothetical protein A6E01_13540 [Vibrio breoganii]|uniref:Uncharacterized protein n=2 Tax=Vibrio breoganii TaxID=553239 RepID=A0AAN0XX36_9VIBR|nr:hypothetical protein A6E01_13540 [Vibrio breoganii]
MGLTAEIEIFSYAALYQFDGAKGELCMTLKGLISVLLGEVERPIIVSPCDFEALYCLFPRPITYVGEIEVRVQHYCDTHILVGGLTQEYLLGSAIDHLYEKLQDQHSLLEVEELELKHLELRYPYLY